MKKILPSLLAGLTIGVVATWLVQHSPSSPENAKADAASAPVAKPKENPLHVPPPKRTALGMVLAKPTTATLSPEINAYGRVLDPAPFITLSAEAETARLAVDASARELARLEKLFAADVNTSAQSVETASAALARDRTAAAATRARLIATWGRRLADVSPSLFAAGALDHETTLLRVDVLPGDTPASALKNIQVGLLGGTEMLDAEVLGPSPVSDLQFQGTSYLALVHRHTLATGAALRVTLPGIGENVTTVVVPRSAILYHEGSTWLYVLEEEDTFERKLVVLGRSLGDGVAITGVTDDAHQVLTTGAQQLLSAELQAGGAAGES